MEDKYNLSLEENLFLAKKMLVNNIYSNARIEGCNVTFPETETILSGVNVANVKLDDIQCILNLRDAWKYAISHIDQEIGLDYICQINAYVARNESLKWGTLRDGKVLISGTQYIPQIPIEESVKKEIQEINEIENITKRAIQYLLYGMKSQLFWDGNKRTSIIVANTILVSHGKGILMVQDHFLQEFSSLLTHFYDTDNRKEIEQFLYKNCILGIDR